MDFLKLQTPHKLGQPVLTGSGVPGTFDRFAVDAPFVFQTDSYHYMMYFGFEGTGYSTALAKSRDLRDWEFHGEILGRQSGANWDSMNAAGTWILRENSVWGRARLKQYDGKYWLVYHSYPRQGYEAGPASIGLAWTEDEGLLDWKRISQPILTPSDDAPWEAGGLYKGCLVEADGRFYLFYNAKNTTTAIDTVVGAEDWYEQIGVAFSDDLVHWTRHTQNPILSIEPGTWRSRFVSDPTVYHDGERWIMVFFGYDGVHAQAGLAYSDDLINWTQCPEPLLNHGPAGTLDETHAHKSSLIVKNDVLYHFYCSCRPARNADIAVNVGDEFRSITVARSTPWKS